MRPMHQANMAPPQQPQHPNPHRNPNTNPHTGHQILSMPTHQPQQHMTHHMQHPGFSHANQRHLMGQNGMLILFLKFLHVKSTILFFLYQ